MRAVEVGVGMGLGQGVAEAVNICTQSVHML